jgi:hypothetical protein
MIKLSAEEHEALLEVIGNLQEGNGYLSEKVDDNSMQHLDTLWLRLNEKDSYKND